MMISRRIHAGALALATVFSGVGFLSAHPQQATAAPVPIEPTRLLDSRSNVGHTGMVAANEIVRVPVAGRAGVSASATGAVLNITVTQPAAGGFLTAFPCGQPVPDTSNLNFLAGQTIPNAVVVGLGGGEVCLRSTQATHLIADVTASFESGSAFSPLTPDRMADTRNGIGAARRRLAAGEELRIAVRGRPGVGSAVSAAVLNLTVTDPAAWGFVTAYPCGQTVPNTSNLNFNAGAVVPNAAVIGLSSDGAVCLVSSVTTHLIVDLMGVMNANAGFQSLEPNRILDSRVGVGAPLAKIGWRSAARTELQVTGRGGVPGGGTGVAVVNLTVTNASDGGWAAAWPCDRKFNGTSNLNFEQGQTVANLAFVPVSNGGKVCLFAYTNKGGSIDLIADVTGWLPGPVRPADDRFGLIGLGQPLPDDVTCAASVRPQPFEHRSENIDENRRTGSSHVYPNYSAHLTRATGNFTGTTDEILQWTACKWGIDEDIVRAQAVTESTWKMSMAGDMTSDTSKCPPDRGLGVDGVPGKCPGSIGILQVSYFWQKPGYPEIINSTAYSADVAYAIWRGCFDGAETWLNTVERGSDYRAGDMWLCVGKYFAGRWDTAAGHTYIAKVRSHLTARTWELPNFPT